MRITINLDPTNADESFVRDWLRDKSKQYGGDLELTVFALALWPAAARANMDKASEITTAIIGAPDVPDDVG